MEFQEVVEKRKMVRSFSPEPIEEDKLKIIIDNIFSGPSAGYSQGTQILVLREKSKRELFFNQWGNLEKRSNYLESWPNLEKAPIIILVFSDKTRYVKRYSENDKNGIARDTPPWWDIDAGMAALLGLLTLVDQNLVGSFTGIKSQEYIRENFNIPINLFCIGAILCGYSDGNYRPSESVKKGKRALDKVVHYNDW